jgi:hypothetical protein
MRAGINRRSPSGAKGIVQSAIDLEMALLFEHHVDRDQDICNKSRILILVWLPSREVRNEFESLGSRCRSAGCGRGADNSRSSIGKCNAPNCCADRQAVRRLSRQSKRRRKADGSRREIQEIQEIAGPRAPLTDEARDGDLQYQEIGNSACGVDGIAR